MRRVVPLALLALLFNGGIAACILDADGFTSGNGLPEGGTGGEAGQDASTTDGATPADGSTDPGSNDGGGTDGSIAGTNILTNAGFEIGCASWHVDFGTIEETNVPRNGAHSCRLCRDGNFETFFSQQVKVAVPKDSEYFGEVWLRTDDSSASRPDVSNLSLATSYSGGEYKGPISIGPPLNKTTWQRITAIMTPPVDGEELNFIVRIQNGEPCVLIDDATFYRTK